MQAEGWQTRRDSVIAALIALAVATALFLDARIDSRVFRSGRAAPATLGRVEWDAAVSVRVDSTLVARRALEEEKR